jgi:acetyltransferase-like isoleucine patch superfamily enzyme
VKAIVSPNCRIRYPELFVVGDDSIVDDFCYFSTQVRVGIGCHIAANVTISGGSDHAFTLGDFSGIASGARIYTSSNDYTNDLVTIPPTPGLATHALVGDVTLGAYTGVGANTVILPGNSVPEGTVIGALSLVPPNFTFEPWAVYFGNPVRYLMPRNREAVLAQAGRFRAALAR